MAQKPNNPNIYYTTGNLGINKKPLGTSDINGNTIVGNLSVGGLLTAIALGDSSGITNLNALKLIRASFIRIEYLGPIQVLLALAKLPAGFGRDPPLKITTLITF